MIIDLIIILILSILILYIIYKSNNIENFDTIISAIEKNTKNINTRKEVCNLVYNNPEYKPCNFKNITLTYFNPYFNSNQDYFLKDYFIASSYKSYQPCGNTRDVYSYDQIKRVLDYGARFINLDVYHNGIFELDDEADPIVCNGDDTGPFINELSVPLKLNQCLNVIKENAWKKSNYPLLLYLNLNTQNNLFVEKKIKDAIINNLGDRLVDKKYSYQNNINPISNASIRELLNKVIILISNKSNENNLPNDPILYEITNGIIPLKEKKDLTNEMINSYYLENYEYGGVKKFIYNINDFIDKTKSHLTILFVENKINDSNIGDSKIDLYNCIDFNEGFNVGINIIPMNYQLITDDNETSNLKNKYDQPSMIRYQNFFQECSFIPKDFQCKTDDKYKTCIETLRIIPKPLYNFNQQDQTLTFNSRSTTLSEQPGFATFNF
jgi:hypothetical protein